MENISDQETRVNNYGWADSMSKVLKAGKPQRKKTPVLAKAKKLSAKKIVSVRTENRNSNVEMECRLRKAEWINKGRQKTTILERNREKMLQKIAVRGVVSLSNAVKELQKNLTEPGKKKFGQRMKTINKKMLLDILRNSVSEKGATGGNKVFVASGEVPRNALDSGEGTTAHDSTWNALGKDFMLGKKRKNWDQA